MKKFLILLLALFHTAAYGGENPAEDIRLHIKVLSSDKYAGRLSGSPGGQKAGEYIANEFKKKGLLPAVAGSYFQPFEIPLKSLGKDNKLVISGRELKVLEDYVPLTVCPPGEVREKDFLQNVIPAEAGIQNGGRSLDSHFRGNDVEVFSREDIPGKIAVVQYDETVPDGGLPAKIKEAEEAGANALLILKQDLYSDYTVWKELIPPKLRARWEKTLKEDFAHFLQMKVTQKRYLTPQVTSKIPCLLVREDQISKKNENVIPAEAGIQNADRGLDSHLRGNDGRLEVFSDEISIKVDITEDKISARNIIGYLPGKGEHKDEVVIIGAHYDHLGLDSKGRYFPGADDNASGVAALLTIAERLAQKGTERSVVFIAFDGEEWGLTVSRYYTEHLVFPLNKTVLMINMDAIGRNEPDAIHFLGSQRSPDVRRLADEINMPIRNTQEHENSHPHLNPLPDGEETSLPFKGRDREGMGVFSGEIADKSSIKLLDDIEFAFKYGSDHYSFYEKGIPAIDLTSSYHEDFHRITDTPEKVNVDKVSKIADLVYRLTLEVAGSGVYFQKPLQADVPFPGQ